MICSSNVCLGVCGANFVNCSFNSSSLLGPSGRSCSLCYVFSRDGQFQVISPHCSPSFPRGPCSRLGCVMSKMLLSSRSPRDVGGRRTILSRRGEVLISLVSVCCNRCNGNIIMSSSGERGCHGHFGTLPSSTSLIVC